MAGRVHLICLDAGYIQWGGYSWQPIKRSVTPDGCFVIADESQNTDLFWALRGGSGGTFGIVTSVTVKHTQSCQSRSSL